MNDFQKHLMMGASSGVQLNAAEPIALDVASAIISKMLGQYRLMSALMLNCGLHPRECVNLRVRHFCHDKHQLIVPNAAGFSVRTSFVSVMVYQDLIDHINYLSYLHDDELKYGFGQVRLPDSFANTDGRFSYDFGWQWLFSRRSLSIDDAESDDSRETLILEVLKRRINHAAKLIKGVPPSIQDGFEVDVFWKSYLAGIKDH